MYSPALILDCNFVSDVLTASMEILSMSETTVNCAAATAMATTTPRDIVTTLPANVSPVSGTLAAGTVTSAFPASTATPTMGSVSHANVMSLVPPTPSVTLSTASAPAKRSTLAEPAASARTGSETSRPAVVSAAATGPGPTETSARPTPASVSVSLASLDSFATHASLSTTASHREAAASVAVIRRDPRERSATS